MNRAATVTVLIVLAQALVVMAGPSEALSKADDDMLRRTAEDLRAAILREDAESVLRFVSSAGLGCTDTQVPYSRVKRDLHDKNSHLYLSLFDSSRFSKRCGTQYPPDFPAISDRDFFLSTRDGPVEIHPLGDGMAQVVFRSDRKDLYQREYDFRKEAGVWKLVYGLIVGSCSCG